MEDNEDKPVMPVYEDGHHEGNFALGCLIAGSLSALLYALAFILWRLNH